MKNILVTGVGGFIGSAFSNVYIKKYPDIRVVGVDDFSSGRRDAIPEKVLLEEGSIIDAQFLQKIFSKYKPEIVFHFAALPRVAYSVEHPRETSDVNVLGTVSLLELATQHGVKRFVFSSSSSVYGNTKNIPTKEDNSLKPESPYAVQKAAAELFMPMFSKVYGLDTVSLRYFNVYGPGQYGDSPYSTVISAWLEALYFPNKIRKPYLEGDGEQTRDFCFVEDVIQANILAASSEKKFGGSVINIGSGVRTNLLNIKTLLEEFSNNQLELEKRLPREGDVKHTCADISRARTLLNYNPQTNLREGLEKTIKWFERRNK